MFLIFLGIWRPGIKLRREEDCEQTKFPLKLDNAKKLSREHAISSVTVLKDGASSFQMIQFVPLILQGFKPWDRRTFQKSKFPRH